MNSNWKAPLDTALIGVDLTNDFSLPEGALSVKDGDAVIPIFNDMSAHFLHIVWTKEEHDAHHDFFASSTPGKKPLDTVETAYGTQYLWPDHCVKGTPGAEFHKDLIVSQNDMIVIKGTNKNIHSYSAVYMDDRKTIICYPDDGKSLPEKLRDRNIKRVAVGGLAYDFCAGFTAYDLAKEGFEVYLIRDACRSICIPVGSGKTTDDLMDEIFSKFCMGK